MPDWRSDRAVFAIPACAVLAFGALSCENGAGADGGAPTPTTSSSAEVAPTASSEALPFALSAMELGELPLAIDAPDGSSVQPAVAGERGITITGPVTVLIREAFDAPKDLAEAKKRAASLEPENMSDEELPDGYVLMFEKSPGDQPGYWLRVQRKLKDASYLCSTVATTEEQRRTAVAMCKSLRAK